MREESENNIVIKHSFVQVNEITVHLQQFLDDNRNILRFATNKQTTLEEQSKKDNNDLVIFVPGNPGVLGIYHDFLYSLQKQLKGQTIIAISHNDFDTYPVDLMDDQIEERISIKNDELNFVEKTLAQKYLHQDPYHIELQVLNKLITLRRILRLHLLDGDRPNRRIVFVGHSIGCYIILRLLQDKQLSSAHAGSILIHPALENMASTKKGQFYDRVFSLRLELFMQSGAYLIDTLLPNWLKLTLTKLFCSKEFIDRSSMVVVQSIIQLVSYKTLSPIIAMAKSELNLIKDLDSNQMIKELVPKLKLIYAIDDHWVNDRHREQLRRQYPDIYMEELDRKHAFVMDSDTVGEYVEKVDRFIKGFLLN